MTVNSLISIGRVGSLGRTETNPFAMLQQEMDRLFDGFSRNFPVEGYGAKARAGAGQENRCQTGSLA